MITEDVLLVEYLYILVVPAVENLKSFKSSLFLSSTAAVQGLVVTGTQGARECIKREVQREERRMKVGRFRDPAIEKKLHLVVPPANQRLTFVKANMNESLASFGPFPHRTYLELRGLKSGLNEASRHSGTSPLGFDCF